MSSLLNMSLRAIILSLIFCSYYGCGHSQSPQQEAQPAPEVETQAPINIEPARYKATINLDHVPDSLRGFSLASEVFFGLEENNRFVYSVNAMGKSMDDVGQWAVKGDSLYIFNLEKGPNTRFKLESNQDGTFNIYGPNNFILQKEAPVEQIKN